FKPKGAAPIIRRAGEDSAAPAMRAAPAPRALQQAPLPAQAPDPLAFDPDIAAVAAVADSFARSPVREPSQRHLDSLEPAIMPEEYSAVPGYGAAGRAEQHEEVDEEEFVPRAQRSGGRRGLVLVASLLGVVLVGTLAVFGFKGLTGGGSS